jgi:glutathione synthase/RimK-type ligase-like ATP-grasp enzyme
MPRPRIAIATCNGYDDLKVDDELLRAALAARGAEAERVVWDDPETEWGGYDLCLLRSTWDYHEKHGEFLAWARRVAAETRLANPADLVAWNSDKAYLRELAEAGVPVVPTVWVERGEEIDAEAVLAERGWEEAVIKPAVDLGAKNLHRVRAGAGEAEGALAAVLARGAAMLQSFLPSLEAEGELSLIYLDGELSHAVRKRPAPGDFRVQSIWGGTMAPAEPTARDKEIGALALSQLAEPPLYARVDLVTGLDGNPRLIELELIEPNLYLVTHPTAAEALAAAALLRIDVDADRDVLQ